MLATVNALVAVGEPEIDDFFFRFSHKAVRSRPILVGCLFTPPANLSEMPERLECPKSTRYDLGYRGLFYESPTFDL